MKTKTTLALVTAIAAFSVGTAYAAGDKTAPGATTTPSTTTSPADQASQKPMTKEEALANGVSEAAFKKADVNGDGILDEKEIKAYNAQQGSKKQ